MPQRTWVNSVQRSKCTISAACAPPRARRSSADAQSPARISRVNGSVTIHPFMAFRLLPREEKFYTDFQALGDELKRDARLLEEMLTPDKPTWDKADEIKE